MIYSYLACCLPSPSLRQTAPRLAGGVAAGGGYFQYCYVIVPVALPFILISRSDEELSKESVFKRFY